MDENLPAEWDSFFTNGGELPDTMKTMVPEVVEAPAQTPAPVDEVVADPTPAPAPVNTPSTEHYDRLLQAQQEQAAQLKQQLADLQAKFAKVTEPPAPDEATDPLGYLAHQMKQIQAKIDAAQATAQTQQQQTAEQTQFTAFINNVNSQVIAFKATHADYDDAYKHLIDLRTADYADRGMTATQAREAVGKEEMEIAAKAMQMGKNPAEVAYGMAKRYGFAPKVAQTAPENKLDAIKKGLESTKDVEGAAAPAKVTLSNLKEASDRDLDRMVQNDWEAIFGKSKGIFG